MDSSATTAHVATGKTEASPPEMRGLGVPQRAHYFAVSVANVVLRFLLFACALVAVSVMATSDETEVVALPFPPYQAPLNLRFTDSPAFVYFITALSVTGLYSFITTILSLFAVFSSRLSRMLLRHFFIFDVLLLAVVAAATGAAATVAYIGLHGNYHVGWGKVCNTYGSFCRYIAGAVIISFLGSILLLMLVLLSPRSTST